MRIITRSLLILATITAVIGCASSDKFTNTSWHNYASHVADERLAKSANFPASPKSDVVFLNAYTSDDSAQPEQTETPTSDIERGPLPGFFETAKRDLKAAPRILWDDTKAVYTDPWNLVFLVGAGGASLALRPEVDDDIEDYYQDHHTFSQDWRDAFSVAGNPGLHFALAGVWYYAGQQMQDDKTYEVGKNMFSALAITGLSTMLLKVSANTDSPNGEQWAWPSGHVSSTMAMATILNDAYGPLVGVPMFGLTALVGIERLDDREHHFSDLIFGAALGWVVAETVIKEHAPQIFGGEIRPYIDPINQHTGIAWVKTLGN
ncbi:MAG: phosphatase PAP2 family protein [Planctomycetota bacterium]|jgi:membrane-associated phospholipid phosphatase